jgi:glucose-6-phosphate dehydrogenase assembly protein OpcA
VAHVVATRSWRSTTPGAIEASLSALWREAAGQDPIARAVMSNLVVYRERTGAATPDLEAFPPGLPLEAVVARHPSRVILLEHERGHADPCAPFAAAVGVATFGAAGGRYGVEQIAVRSNCVEQSLPSIVRRLLKGGVPTSVWWIDDVSRVPPLEALVRMGRQFVYDSRGWHDVRRGVRALAPLLSEPSGVDVADLNWRRLAPLRQALVHAATLGGLEALRLGHVRVTHRPGDAALAWLIVGWLHARLGWGRNVSPDVEEAAEGGEILSMLVGGPAPALTVSLNGHRVLVTHLSGSAGFTVAVPQEGEADAVAAELRNLSHDVCLHDAISALVRTFNAA